MHKDRAPEALDAAAKFHSGADLGAHGYLGFHREGDAALFRVWAPHAERVSLIADCNGWDDSVTPMTPVGDSGIWEVSLNGADVPDGSFYKFCIRNGGSRLEKADPFAVCAELPPKTASVIAAPPTHPWRDAGWMAYRRDRFTRERVGEQPIHIYVLHAGAWKRHADGGSYSYRELAAELVHYVKQMGFTHVELMPLAEHPCGERTHEVSGLFAPTARYGAPDGLTELVDTLHEAGLGVLLELPTRPSADAHALCRFDGQPLLESADDPALPDLRRPEVCSLLLSCAAYWIETYHLDGLCVDTEALLRHRTPEATDFLRTLNRLTAAQYPDVMLIANGSAADGLGFTLIRDRTPNDLSVCAPTNIPTDPPTPAPIAHGHRICTLPEQGATPTGVCRAKDGEVDLAGLRMRLLELMTAPCKKRLFMGVELGQLEGVMQDGSVDWSLADREDRAALQYFVAELGNLYLAEPALRKLDADPAGTDLLNGTDSAVTDPLRDGDPAQPILVYRRTDRAGRLLLIALNPTSTAYEDHPLPVPSGGNYAVLLSTDEARFGGNGSSEAHTSLSAVSHGDSHTLLITLPPHAGVVLERV